jgi:GDP/UDP-N,N'-diacetylbacillosamine 2-epimerase (hydrolysing)
MNKSKKNIQIKKKIIIFSVGRSDLSILKNLITKIAKHSKLNLDLVVCGAHYSSKFGRFKNEFKLNKNKIHYFKIKYHSSENKDIINYFTKHLYFSKKLFEKKKYDAAIILGDRYEMLAVAITCLNFKIPIMHFCGGSITAGSLDNIYRYCISKIAKAHFVETQNHKKNLNEIGIFKNIFIIGAPALENFKKNLLTKKQLEKKFKIKLNKNYMICTFHPETTTTKKENIKNLIELIKFLNKSNYFKIFTYPNADEGFVDFISIIKKRLNLKNVLLTKNLGRINYYSFFKYSNLIIGNSSSGIIESASFQKPTINLGNRQKNRYCMKNVIHCDFDQIKIEKAFARSQSEKFLASIKKIKNEYEKKNTSSNSIKIINKILKND